MNEIETVQDVWHNQHKDNKMSKVVRFVFASYNKWMDNARQPRVYYRSTERVDLRFGELVKVHRPSPQESLTVLSVQYHGIVHDEHADPHHPHLYSGFDLDDLYTERQTGDNAMFKYLSDQAPKEMTVAEPAKQFIDVFDEWMEREQVVSKLLNGIAEDMLYGKEDRAKTLADLLQTLTEIRNNSV